ncbi:amidohydrolase family protein [Thermodesulfobacteriota bacterium]
MDGKKVKPWIESENVTQREKAFSSPGAGDRMMIDVFPHIMPPKYVEALHNKTPVKSYSGRFGIPHMPSMYDVEDRLRVMDRFEGYSQILNISLPAVEDVAKPEVAVELAKIANDEMAELVMKYPDRFIAAAACLPLNDMDEALKELDRAITELSFRGVQITTTIMDKPLDSPEFEPLFEKMSYYNLPVLLHPRFMQSGPRAFPIAIASIPYENLMEETEHWAQLPYYWPYETTLAMGHIVYSGLLDKYPNLKIITHHCGGVTPFQAHRVDAFRDFAEMRIKDSKSFRVWARKPLDYYKMIYGDTACYGNKPALMCGLDFFGVDHVIFGTDMPWDNQNGVRFIRDTIRSVQQMDISEEDREKIFSGNAIKLFRLPV